MKQYIERMINEKKELEGRIGKAEKAIASNPFDMDETSKHLLGKQVDAMKVYADILDQRIKYETGK